MRKICVLLFWILESIKLIKNSTVKKRMEKNQHETNEKLTEMMQTSTQTQQNWICL